MGDLRRDAAAQGQVLTVAAPLTADEVIAHLKLGPHPEGGYFRETMWHWYGGAPLLLEIKHNDARHEHRLGPDWLKGEHPHVLVPPGAWQSARSLGPWTLSGCTVAPGFDFAGHELAPEGFEP